MKDDKNFLTLSIDRFEQLSSLGDKTLAQISEDDARWSPNAESNSIAVIVQHLHGNMLSRFTDFLTTDGEKQNRHRDEEFIEHKLSVEELKKMWSDGWDCVFAAIRPLTNADLNMEVFIRGESQTVMEAILRQISHYGYHVGQIVYIGKHLKSSEWKTLSIARGKIRRICPAFVSTMNGLHHIEINVSDLPRSIEFWDWLLTELGYSKFQEWPKGKSWKIGDTYIVLVQTEEKHLAEGYNRKRTGLNHIALHVESRKKIDELTREIRKRCLKILYEEKHPFAGGDDHYALYFEDPNRIKIELVAP